MSDPVKLGNGTLNIVRNEEVVGSYAVSNVTITPASELESEPAEKPKNVITCKIPMSRFPSEQS